MSKKNKPWVDLEVQCKGNKKDVDPPLTEWKEDRTIYLTSPQDVYLINDRLKEGGQLIAFGNFPNLEDWNQLANVLSNYKTREAKSIVSGIKKKGLGSGKKAAAPASD